VSHSRTIFKEPKYGRLGRDFAGIGLSMLLGVGGGIVCGAIILSICGLLGRSHTTGANYVGYWTYGLLLIGAMYGGPMGLFMGPLGYFTAVRIIGFKRAILPASIGTLIGGIAGALIEPILGVISGTAGFFVALLIARFRHGAATH